MPGRSGPRGSALGVIANRVVSLHKEHLGRGPALLRVYDHGELLVLLIRDPYTAIEQTLAEGGHAEPVRKQRSILQRLLRADLTSVIRAALDCDVEAFMSANHHDPDLMVEVVVLGHRSRPPEEPPRASR